MSERQFRFSLGGLVLGLGLALGVAKAEKFEPLNELPEELRLPDAAVGLIAPKKIETLEVKGLRFRETANGFKVELQGSRPVLRQGMPELPVLIRKIKGDDAATVFLKDLKLEQTKDPIALATTPQAHVWEPQSDLKFSPESKTRFFPGKFFTAKALEGEITVQFFPVQYDRKTKKLIVARSAELMQLVSPIGEKKKERGEVTAEDPSIILTSESLRPAAEVLQSFHRNRLAMPSAIITVEEIARSTAEIDEAQLPEGYKAREVADAEIFPYSTSTNKGYHYALARKISAYLQEELKKDTGLRYLTILGDVTVVPPSYYFVARSSFAPVFTPTDQCYAAINKCEDPRLSVGRLPFTTIDEVERYLAKVERWLDEGRNQETELSLYGGRPFAAPIYTGELGTLKTLANDKVNWRRVQKYFRSKKNYSTQKLLNLFSGESETAFAYHLDHGTGNQLYVEQFPVTTNAVMALSGEKFAPLIASISCTNAAYDEIFSVKPLFNKPDDGPKSVGVALLQSPVGAVAYLGGARPTLGNPVYDIDKKGNLTLTGTNYGLQILDTFFEKYHAAGRGRLGDFVLATHHAFMAENGNDLTDEGNLWSYFTSTLLGDPVLPLPVRELGDQAMPLASSLTQIVDDFLSAFPILKPSLLPMTLNVESKTAGTLSLIKTDVDEVIFEKRYVAGQFPVLLDKSLTEGRYFARLENADGVPREHQIWLEVKAR